MRPIVTHAGELMSEIHQSPSIRKVEKSHYTAKGVRSVIVDDYDGQKYEVIINPLYEREEKEG